MTRVRALRRRLAADRGATAVEYGLLIALVAVVTIPAIWLLRDNSASTFSTTVEAEDGVTICTEGDPTCSAFNALPAANLPGVPSVTTLAATAVGTSGATLNASVNANGTSTAVTFCIGTAADLTGCTVVNGSPANATGSSATAVSAVRTGLATNTTYYFRVIGTSAKGTRFGATLSFVTGTAGSTAPTASTVAATDVAGTSATLNGFVVPGGLSTNVTFCYGTQSNLNNCTSIPASPATVTGTTGQAVSVALTGLTSNRTYYYRVAAANGLGSDTGNRLSFTTGAAVTPPTVVTVAANSVAATTATLRGTVSGNRQDDGSLKFCFGSTAAIADACSSSVSAGTYRKNDTTDPVSANVTGLSPAVTYYFRLVATNDGNGVQGLGELLTFTTGQATQTISFTAPTSPNEVSATEALAATATSGLVVTFGSTTPSVCSVSGTTASYLSVGTCTLTANQAGNTAYAAAPQETRTVTVTKRSQTITFAAPATPRVLGDTASVSATSSAGLAVTLVAMPSSTCTLSSGTVSYSGTGTCTITATQPGDATWAAATSVVRTVTVTKRIQTITFAAPVSPRLINDTAAVSATSDSGLTVTLTASPSGTCTLSSGTVTYRGAGTCTITATQAGNATWESATVTRTVTVTKRPQTITFTLPSSARDGAKLDLDGTATSRLAVSYDASPSSVCQIKSGKLELKKEGICRVTANQPGDDTWDEAPEVVLDVEVT